MENSAARLHAMFSRVKGAKDDLNAVDMWAQSLGLIEQTAHARTIEVLQRLVWIDDELNVLIRALETEREYPEEGYAVMRQGVQQALGVQPLNNKAVHVKQYLDERVMVALQQMAINLSRTENSISPEQLAELASLVDALESQLEGADLEPALDAVLRRHIRLLRRAIDAYPVWGVRAFSDSLRDALGELMVLRERSTQPDVTPAERSALDALKAAWTTVNRYVTEADKVRKAASLVNTAHHALEWVQRHLP